MTTFESAIRLAGKPDAEQFDAHHVRTFAIAKPLAMICSAICLGR
jgi:hypothetical protein